VAVIGLSFMFFCCSQNPEFDEIIDLTKKKTKVLSLVDLFYEFEYISLETSEESIFGSIQKLIIHEDSYYILDPISKKIFVFLKDGSFVRTIGNIGKGPGEYTHIEDFVIDEENGEIIILGFPSIIYIYDLEGNFVQHKQLSIPPVFSMFSYADGFAFSNNHQCINVPLIYFFDKKFNITDEIGKTLDKGSALPPFVKHPFLKDGKNIVYFDNFNSSIINIHPINENLMSFLLPNPIPPDVLLDAQKFFTNQGNYSFFLDVFFADNILWTSFVDKGNMFVFVRDMTTKKQIIAKYDDWYPNIMYHENHYFYTTLNVESILDDKPIIKFAKSITKYPIDDNSNHVIVKFKAKTLFK